MQTGREREREGEGERERGREREYRNSLAIIAPVDFNHTPHHHRSDNNQRGTGCPRRNLASSSQKSVEQYWTFKKKRLLLKKITEAVSGAKKMEIKK